MKLASFNVNSVKARTPHIQNWLNKESPDALLIQELKGVEENFPYAAFEELGYQATVKGQKAYNGVAILTKKPATLISNTLPGDEEDEQARFIDIKYGDIHIINIYLPNGNPVDTPKFNYKLAWMQRLYTYLKDYTDRRIPFLIGGDFNVIPEDIDCCDPAAWAGDALFRMETRKAYRKLIHLGLTEAYRAIHPDTQEFTFWDYQAGAWPKNNGIRIDHFLLSPAISDCLVDCNIDKQPRGEERASDHTPIWIELEMQNLNKMWKETA